MNETQLIERSFLRSDVPVFRPGDTVKVHVRVVEGNRERVQVFQGVVIRRQGGGVRETFTVRKISFGVGVERTFPVHSPSIAKLEVVQRGQVRRAKLYYLRELRGKKARIRERRVDEAKIAAQEAARADGMPLGEPDETIGVGIGDAELEVSSDVEAGAEGASAEAGGEEIDEMQAEEAGQTQAEAEAAGAEDAAPVEGSAGAPEADEEPTKA